MCADPSYLHIPTQPAIAQGNVGELAIDILIASLGSSRVATLEHEDVLPCVGNDPFDAAGLTTAMELHELLPGGTPPHGACPATAGKMQVLLACKLRALSGHSYGHRGGSPYPCDFILQVVSDSSGTSTGTSTVSAVVVISLLCTSQLLQALGPPPLSAGCT